MFRGVISREEWGAAAPTQNAGPQAYDAGLILHWEGPKMWGDLWAFAHDSCYEKVRGIQRYHMNVGYSDIAYNDVICPHGYIFNGRSGVNMANAASGDWWVNHHTEATCFLWGEGDDILTNNPDPIDALNALRNFGMAFAGMSSETRPHRAIVATSCPGDELTYVAGLLNGAPPQPVNSADSGGTPVPPPAPPVVQPAPVTDPILSIGDSGPAVADWQQWLNVNSNAGLDVDGDFGPATEAAVKGFQLFWKQHNPDIDVDGVIGPQTWDLRRFVDYLATLPPAPAPVPDPIPDPIPDPEPVPEPETPDRMFTDLEISVIIDVILDYKPFLSKKKQDKIRADLASK